MYTGIPNHGLFSLGPSELTLGREALQKGQLVQLERQPRPREAVIGFRQLLGMLLRPCKRWLHILRPQLRE